jgi:integrase
MARRVKDATLDSKDARRKLKARGKPYYRVIERGLHLGYRKLQTAASAGTWVARHYVGAQSYEVESIGVADDLSDADGVKVLDYWQAQAKARERMKLRVHASAGKSGPISVADAMEEYLEFLDNNKKSAVDARARNKAFVEPKLGSLEIEALTAKQLRHWLTELAKQPRRLRTGKDEKQKYSAPPANEEAKRRRKATANRTLTVLKAALNRAWREGRVSSDTAWRRVEPFENVEAARLRYASVEEAKRLLNASDTDFRELVNGGLQTGARYGELVKMQVSDFSRDAGTVAVRQSKGGKSRHIVLTDEGVAFFKQLCAGRAGSELIFVKSDGGPWKAAHQARPMIDANKRAKITPPITFHGLRHTWASHAVMNGVPLMIVAKNLGHSDTRMVEKHYGHLAPSYVADAIRAGAPRFGTVEPSNVRELGR